jgi:lipopolysaccharide transport system ATP-binding protein
MYVRLAFAVAAHLEPEILIVDEVLAVGDASFQKKCLGKMQTVSREEGRMVLFVSHNLQQVRQFCRRGLLLQAGRVVADGNIHSVLNTYHSSLESSSGNTREDGQTRIETIRFVNAMGAAVERVDRGDEMHFVAEVRVNIEIVRPLLSIALLHGDQQPVFSEFWQIPFALPVGLHRIRGHFATSVLKPEAYFFTTFLYEGETCLDKLEGQSLPEIVDLAGDPLIEARRWGVVRVPVTWDMN